MQNKTQQYFEKEFSDFDASYKEGRGIKDIIRRLAYTYNKKAIKDRLNALLTLVGDKIHNLKILEIGCGPGVYSIELAKKGAAVTALDYSGGMIEAAKKNALNHNVSINFILNDFFSWNTNSTYDYIFATGVIEYIEPIQQLQFLRKMASLSNDYVIISFPKKFVLHAILRWVWLVFFKRVKVSFFSNKKISFLSKQAGFMETDRIDIGILWVIKFCKGQNSYD